MCDKIEKLLNQNNGILTSKDAKENNISSMKLSRLVNNGCLERVKRGLYVSKNSWGDEYYNLIYNNNAIFSYDTALYLLGLSESVPSIYDITVVRGYNASLKYNDKVNLHFVKKEELDDGRIKIKSPQGQMIDCYCPERCICELLSNKNNQDIETIKYAIKTYLKDVNNRNISKLMKYAEKYKVKDIIDNYIEVLS